jgi:hypothetical protein
MLPPSRQFPILHRDFRRPGILLRVSIPNASIDRSPKSQERQDSWEMKIGGGGISEYGAGKAWGLGSCFVLQGPRYIHVDEIEDGATVGLTIRSTTLK